MSLFWDLWCLFGPVVFLFVGIYVGGRLTEAEAVSRRRERLLKAKAKGQRAERERRILDGNAPRIRQARIVPAHKRGKFPDQEGG